MREYMKKDSGEFIVVYRLVERILQDREERIEAASTNGFQERGVTISQAKYRR